jgi:2'-5' RNA ligase
MPPILTIDTDHPHQIPGALAAGGFPTGRDRPPLSSFIPRSSDPVFLALYPPKRTAYQINRLAWDLRDQHQLRGRPLEEERIHTTLCSLGRYADLRPGAITAIGDALAIITMPPFLLGLNRVISFSHKGKHPLILHGDEGVAGVMMLRDELVTTMRKAGFPIEAGSYTPHTTLLYDARSIDDRSIDEIRWMVREVVLVCSLYGRHQHVTLGRWPLRAPDRLN